MTMDIKKTAPRSHFSDEQFLKKIVKAASFLSQAMVKQMVCIKNTESEYVFCSNYFAKLIGIKPSDLLGKKIWLALYDNAIEFEQILKEEDQFIMHHRQPRIVFKINRFKNGLTPYTSIKYPLLNPSTNNVVGIFFQGFEIGTLDVKKYLTKRASSLKKNSVEPSQLPVLSKREKQIIFFFLANLSSQEIANLLHQMEGKKISKSTIDSLFNDQLYPKFKVYSRPALYKKLQEMGFEQRIPKELLTGTSIIIEALKSY